MDGEHAIFEDVGSIPTSMSGIRVAVALSAFSDKLWVKQADCLRAYTQAKHEGIPTFIRMPRAWWPLGLKWPIRYAG